MTHGRTQRRAFTLVEILIVVVILGILAAIVIPQFTNASEEASESSVRSMLQTVRSQIELFRVKNQGDLPALGTANAADGSDWIELVNPMGTDGLTRWEAGGDVPPYLQSAPVNPFQSTPGISTAAGLGVGWVWEAGLGKIYAVNKDGTQNMDW